MLHVLTNGVRWCAFCGNDEMVTIVGTPNEKEPFEELSPKDYDMGDLDHPAEAGAK